MAGDLPAIVQVPPVHRPLVRAEVGALRRREHLNATLMPSATIHPAHEPSALGLHTTIKPLISRFTTREFNSPLNMLKWVDRSS
eukprot:1330892-Pyramimonas_sp.AAC.1